MCVWQILRTNPFGVVPEIYVGHEDISIQPKANRLFDAGGQI
jgi:hypothetical protein